MVKEYVVWPFIQGGTTSIHFSMKVTLLMKTGCCLSVIVIGVIGMVRYKTLQFSLFVHKVYRSVLRAQPSINFPPRCHGKQKQVALTNSLSTVQEKGRELPKAKKPSFPM